MNVGFGTKLEPFTNSGNDGFTAYYVWNEDDELDLLGTVTSSSEKSWTHTHSAFGAFTSVEDAVSDLVREVRTKRISQYADELLRKGNAGVTDSWREDD
jgi:hypothetical protein